MTVSACGAPDAVNNVSYKYIHLISASASALLSSSYLVCLMG